MEYGSTILSPLPPFLDRIIILGNMPYNAINDSLACATQATAVKLQIGKLCQVGWLLKLTIEHSGLRVGSL